jgi:hypothetical protein
VQLKYPSALNFFEQIANYAQTKKIAMFLDYDGVLSPIVDDPDNALLSNDVRVLCLFVLCLIALSCLEFHESKLIFVRCVVL